MPMAASMKYPNLIETLNASGKPAYYIAYKVGISEPQLSRIKHGKNTPSVQTLKKLCAVLDISIDYALEKEEPLL